MRTGSSRGASRIGIAVSTVVLLCGTPAGAWAQAFANAPAARVDYRKAEIAPAGRCEALSTFTAEGLVQIDARPIAEATDAPAHCRVSGTITPEVAFEVNLPARWNGRFYMIGNGGHAGQAPDDPGRAAERATALRNGFAIATTNTGHDSRKEPGASFVMSNPQKAIDYAYRAVHETAVTAKALARTYYARPVSKAYWNSCSNGGRQGLIEAQRYPEDFDGIVANAPWVDQTGFTIGALWNQRALLETPVPPAKLALVAERVMAACDAVDGLADGLIDDPRACRFDPRRDVPACSPGTDAGTCLTEAQAATIARIYDGPRRNGQPFFPGFMYGSEAMATGADGTARSGWLNPIVPAEPDGRAADFNLAENTMKYLVFDPPRPDYDYRTFDFERDTGLLDRWGRLANADNPDLSAFRGRGGKLLMTYGWADTVLQPMMGVRYYERALATNGPGTPDFFRLFMIPGMAHCGGGVGPDRHDAVTAIIEWVEAGVAPASMTASKLVKDMVVRTRPLCPYPQVARYRGTGSIDDAASFQCVAPAP